MTPSTPLIALVGSAHVHALAARCDGVDARVRALVFDRSNPASREDLRALLAEPGTQDDVMVTSFENDPAARSFFVGENARALRGWSGAMLDTSVITPNTLRQIVSETPGRFCAGAFGRRERDGEVWSVLYLDRAALGTPATMRVAGLLADDMIMVADAAKAKALAIIEALLVGVNAAIVDEALVLAEASGVAAGTIIPLIQKGSGATAVMALRGSAAGKNAVGVADGSGSVRNGLLRALVAAREVEHPLLFASVASASHAFARFPPTARQTRSARSTPASAA